MSQYDFVVIYEDASTVRRLEPSAFTENQRRAILYICARAGIDPFPIPEDHGTPAPAGMDRKGDKVARRATSKAQGYTGDECSRCHMFTMKQSGHCLVCDSCGETTGCS